MDAVVTIRSPLNRSPTTFPDRVKLPPGRGLRVALAQGNKGFVVIRGSLGSTYIGADYSFPHLDLLEPTASERRACKRHCCQGHASCKLAGMGLHRIFTLAPLVFVLSGACTDKPAVPTADSSTPAPTIAPSAASAVASSAATAPEEEADAGAAGTKKRRFREAGVFVDGEAVAGLKFLELPQKLPVRWTLRKNGRHVRRYRLAEYVEALGVPLSTVKQVHIVGGRNRIAIVEGAELQKVREKLLFSFTQSEKGRPRMHFPSGGMKVNSQLDTVQDIMIYQHKKPPNYDLIKHRTYFDDGKTIVGVPYATDERVGGTRVYVDGVLLTAIKRKTLPEKVEVPGSAEQGLTRFSLLAYLENIKIPADSVKAVELVVGDKVDATFDTAAFKEKIPSLVFTLPKRNNGRIQVMDLVNAGEKLDAILLYVKESLPDRAALANPPGSLKAQPATQNR